MVKTPLVIGLALLSLTAMGCKEKVDCKKMQARLTECMHENYSALNKKGRDLKDPRFKKDLNSVTKDYVKIIDKEYYEKCTAIGGKEKRAKKINMCLSEKSCVKVHACLKEVLN